MPVLRASVPDMDIGTILYSAEIEAPMLRQTRRILEQDTKLSSTYVIGVG